MIVRFSHFYDKSEAFLFSLHDFMYNQFTRLTIMAGAIRSASVDKRQPGFGEVLGAMWMGEKYPLRAGDGTVVRHITRGERAVTFKAGAFLTAVDTAKPRPSSQIAVPPGLALARKLISTGRRSWSLEPGSCASCKNMRLLKRRTSEDLIPSPLQHLRSSYTYFTMIPPSILG